MLEDNSAAEDTSLEKSRVHYNLVKHFIYK